MAKKSRFEIMAEMLEAAKQGSTLRKLRGGKYGKGNDFAKRYVSLLVNSGLLKHDKDVYRITAKGRLFLKKYKEIQV